MYVSKQEDYFNQALKRKLEGMGLSSKEVERALQESDDFVDGLDEVFDSMFPVVPKPDPIEDSDDDIPPLGAIL